MTILEQLAEYAQIRTQKAEQELPLALLKEQALALPKGIFAFENALRNPGVSFICECKKASPSKGLIAPEFPYLQIAREYEAAGADRAKMVSRRQYLSEGNRRRSKNSLSSKGFYSKRIYDL